MTTTRARCGRTSMPSENDGIVENYEDHDQKDVPKSSVKFTLTRLLCRGRKKYIKESKTPHSSSTLITQSLHDSTGRRRSSNTIESDARRYSNKSGRRSSIASTSSIKSLRRRNISIEVNRSSTYSQDSPQDKSPSQIYSIAQITSVLAANSETKLSKAFLAPSIDDFQKMMKIERRQDWAKSFYHLDPRYQINKLFNDVSRSGGNKVCEGGKLIVAEEALVPIALKSFREASAFSVFRPTSNDAIRKLMLGEAVGKGLEVKGKSAKTGVLSGFIPFVQIHEEKHKDELGWPSKCGSVRIYYKTEDIRNEAVEKLTSLSNKMVRTVSEAKEIVANACSDKEEYEQALRNLILDVVDPEVHILNNNYPSRFGIDVAERLFFIAYVVKNDVSRCETYNTGLPSEPAFQDMTSACIRTKDKPCDPRAVAFQTSESVDDALSSKSLIIAYEENGNVTPIASDFDCLLVVTRNVDYPEPLPKDQVDLVKWLLTQITTILDSPITSQSWTSRWLAVLKESTAKGFHPEIPKLGFGDPKSYAIMEQVVARTKDTGAVRHGAECFNYYFPQELDERFLVISDHLENNLPWKYVNVRELQDILCNMIDEGFTFPLNPKWILADHGWKAVYDKLMASDNERVQQSLDAWYPPESGIRELIEDIYKRFPNGFQRSNIECDNQDVNAEGTEAMDRAQQQLKRHLILQRAKSKLKTALMMMDGEDELNFGKNV